MFGADRVSAARVFLILVGVLLPFVLNVELARSRGKRVALVMVLTFFLSWIVTLVLFFLPNTEQAKE
jgi:hypothetical protein